MKGHVHLVGAGPGDPGLMTVKGLQLLREAEVVVYDALVDRSFLNECGGAELIDVGKRSSRHTKTQDEINALLIELGKSGKNVVRLKGGDPFLFGRGAEEAKALRDAGVQVSVVPGVSSSIAVPELAGIPVTHRDHASMVTVITGHEMDGKSAPLDWSVLSKGYGTLVILMGMSSASSISRKLIDGGMPSDTGVAIIVNGSTSDQRTVVTSLAGMAYAIEKERLKAPGIIVIGSVVRERKTLGDMS